MIYSTFGFNTSLRHMGHSFWVKKSVASTQFRHYDLRHLIMSLRQKSTTSSFRHLITSLRQKTTVRNGKTLFWILFGFSSFVVQVTYFCLSGMSWRNDVLKRCIFVEETCRSDGYSGLKRSGPCVEVASEVRRSRFSSKKIKSIFRIRRKIKTVKKICWNK